ncbi:unnamed protein product [Paramecium sonneborni]|uniref:Copper transport protein n=1 Tax=Paramecium sonneborni TaxID=65129 RepID=A0A8S1R3N4_9CILI|nr:unnamed protein product [Paramecium sonneborni]
MMDMRMYMIINWDYKVRFIFNNWKTNTYGQFIMALIFTFLFCSLLCTLQVFKGYADKKSKFKNIKIFWTQVSMAIINFNSIFNNYDITDELFRLGILSMFLGFGMGNFIFYLFMPVSRYHLKQDQASLNNQS